MTATKRKPQPITAHPLFPFVTGLWLATGLGLGSFVMAPALLEGPVVALGLPALVPAAAPPLGFTARALVALIMLIVGAVAGYVIGRRIGRPKAEAPVRMRNVGEAAGRRRALVETVGIEATDEVAAEIPEVTSPRHSIMAVEDLGAPLDAPFENADAQLHGQVFNPAADVAESEPEEAALILDAVIEDADDAQTVEAMELVAGLQPSAVTSPVAPPVAPIAEPPAVPFLQAHAATATPLARSPLESLGLVQLVERLALALSERARRHRPVTSAPASASEPETPAPQAEPLPRFQSGFSAGIANPAAFVAPAAVSAADVSVPSAWQASGAERVVSLRPAALQPIAPAAYGDDALAGDQDEDIDLPRFLRMPEAPEAADFDLTDEADEEEADDFDASAEGLPESERPEPEVAEHRYSSLLGMASTGSRREPLRIEDGLALDAVDGDVIEPVVMFPGQSLEEAPEGEGFAQSARPFDSPSIVPVEGSPLAAPGKAAPSARIDALEMPVMDVAPLEVPPLPAVEGALPDADEADRALRAALATLQRMTAQG